ncbi:sensor histidine kinase [Oryzomonas rubra]|uniref:Sensor histidine kinase n=1 Tax=Oryzomonas rubra TaxID=2509454 RepID=A0A5A9XSQ9_9BACT|nr:ATP-binding protein [Oryzomonas rubra]KAA0895288.1 sensor histidine kinase [Oryzomonas rubra]
MTDEHSALPVTRFAPAGRASNEVLAEQRRAVLREEIVDTLIQAMPGYAMLVNEQRQIVALNRNVLKLIGTADDAVLIGKRLGEALNCVHAGDFPGGCGTGDYCSVCGVVLALLNSQESGGPIVRECLVTLRGDQTLALDMQATTTPLQIHDQKFTVVVLQDIGSEKRRQVLERLFFHDVINTTGGIHGLASLLAEQEDVPERVQTEYVAWLVALSENLLDEIRGQRNLLEAEQGEFVPEVSPVSIRTVLQETTRLFDYHDKTPGRNLVLKDGPDCTVATDAAILRRIIGNMTLNALEATPVGGVVTLSADTDGAWVTIDVHNRGVIPPEVQLQLFKRSFSTKSLTGRGIGTYSMKLFGERYLKGKVSFKSCQDEGTTFTFALPLG